MLYDVEYVKDGVNMIDLFESDNTDEEVVKSEFMRARVCTEVVAVTRCDESYDEDEFEEFDDDEVDDTEEDDTTWLDDDGPSEDVGEELEEGEEYDCDDQDETEQK